MTAEAAPQTSQRPGGDPARGSRSGVALAVAGRSVPRRQLNLALFLLVVAVAALLRLWDLGDPHRIYFDEVYYANEAHQIVLHGVEEGRVVHPPLGKLLLGVGIALFGFDPFGWRIAAAVAGILTVALTHLIAMRLLRSPWTAALGPLLLAVDGLAITMSRIAMLDAFVALFVVATAWSVLLEVQRLRGVPSPIPGPNWWAGIFAGAAVAAKWSGLLGLAAAGVVLLVCHALARRRSGASTTGAWGRSALILITPLAVVPAAVYVASYSGWFVNWQDSYHGQQACESPPCTASTAERAHSWVAGQVEIAEVHQRLEATHPYRSDAAGWLILKRPVLYYLEQCTEDMREEGEQCVVSPGNRAKILGLGNPAVWWPALLAYPALAWHLIRRRDGRAGFLLAFLGLQYLPWFLVERPGYLFYMTPVVPFIALAVGYAADRAAEHRALRWMPAALAAAASIACIYFLPLWLGTEITQPAERARLWFSTWR